MDFFKRRRIINPGQLLAKLLIMEVIEDKSEITAKKDAPSARKIMEENKDSEERLFIRSD